MQHPARGASLLEMLLVIALIAALGVLAAAALSGGFAGMQLRSNAKQIAAQLRYTRTQAIATGTPQRFTLDPARACLDRAERPQRRDPAIAGRRLHRRARSAADARARARSCSSPMAPPPAAACSSGKQAAWNIDVAWLTGEVRMRRAEVGAP